MEKIVFTDNQAFEFFFDHNGVRVSVSTGARNILLRHYGMSGGGYMIDRPLNHRDLIDILDEAEKSRDWKDFQIRTGLITKHDNAGYWWYEMQMLTEGWVGRMKLQSKALWYRMTNSKQEPMEDVTKKTKEDIELEKKEKLKELQEQLDKEEEKMNNPSLGEMNGLQELKEKMNEE